MADDDLAGLYAWPDSADPFVRANFVVSLDGRVTGSDGRSGTLGNPADRAVFAHLRSTCDVILVAAGTARAEQYRPVQPHEVDVAAREAAGMPPTPAVAVVSRTLALPDALLHGGPAPTYLVTSVRHAATPEALPRGRLLACGDDEVDLGAAIDELHRRGYDRILCEGGPSLLADLWRAGLVDDLCLTHRAQLVGEGPTMVDGPATGDLRLGHVIESDGALLARYSAVHRAHVAQ